MQVTRVGIIAWCQILLCKWEEKNCLNIFKDCTVVKAFWFRGKWNLRLGNWPATCCINSSTGAFRNWASCCSTSKWNSWSSFPNYGSIHMEANMEHKNKKKIPSLFQKAEVDINVTLVITDKWFQEHLAVSNQQNKNSSVRQTNHWQAPPLCCFRINCDSEISNIHFCAAVATRDWEGNIVATSMRTEVKSLSKCGRG